MNKFSLRKYLFIFYSIIVCGLSSCIGGSTQVESIQVALSPGETSLPFYIARELGFFEANGLHVELIEFDSGVQAYDYLMESGIAYGSASQSTHILKWQAGTNISVLSCVSQSAIYSYAYYPSSAINALADMSGKTIGLTLGSGAAYAMLNDLDQRGVDVGGIHMVNIPAEDLSDSLQQNAVDAVFGNLHEIWNLRQENQNIQSQAVGEQFPVYALLFANAESASYDPSVNQNLLNALVQAVSWIHENPGESRDMMGRFFGYPIEYSVLSWPNHSYEISLPGELLDAMQWETEWRTLQPDQNNNDVSFSEILSSFEPAYLRAIQPELMSEQFEDIINLE